MVNSSQEYVAFSTAEVSYGVVPTTPAMAKLNHRGFTLSPGIQLAQSQLVRDDRNPVDFFEVRRGASAQVESELQYEASGAQLLLFRDAFQSTATTAATTEVTTVTEAGGVLSETGIETGIEVGDIVRITSVAGIAAGDKPTWRRVTAVGTNQITVDSPTPYDGDTDLNVYRGIRLKNGNTQVSRSIERGNATAALYEVFSGMVCSGVRLSARYGDPVRTQYLFVGKKSASHGASAIAGASYSAPPTSQVFNCTSHVAKMHLGGATATFTNFELFISNSLRTREGMSGDGSGDGTPTGVAAGGFTVSGSADLYFENYTEYEKFLAASSSSAVLVFRDTVGNAVAVSLPTMVYTGFERPNGGQDTDVVCRVSFAAKYTSAESGTSRMLWFAA